VKGLTVLLLLGVKTHPVVRILLGAALTVAGVLLHMRLLWLPGALLVVWGACNWVRQARVAARRHAETALRNGAAR
jgi:hypothetical protein